MRVRPIGSSDAIAARRREVERALMTVGRASKDRRRLHVVAPDRIEQGVQYLLRDTLQSLGGAFLLFGRYLAGRRDLLSPPYAIALEQLTDWAEPLDAGMIHDVITTRLGSAAKAFASFEDEPFESQAAWVSHRALLADGRSVIVRVSRPSLLADVDHLDLLAAFEEAVAPAECTNDAFHAAVDDFRDEFHTCLDLRCEQEALKELAGDSRSLDRIAAPRVHPLLCAADVLTYEPAGHATLADQSRAIGAGRDRDDIARRVAAAWLELATFGRVFPVIVRADAIETTVRRRIAFSAGPFRSIPPNSQAGIREYLFHALTDPDRASGAFLRQMESGAKDGVEEELRRQFRQTVPFRDSEWCRAGEDEGYEHYLWVHWRRATTAGLVPLPHMAAFYRGFTSMARTVRALAPAGGDALREAVDDLRKAETIRDVASAVDPNEVLRVAGEYMQLALAMPERIDAVMRQMSDGRTRLRVGLPSDSGAGRPSFPVLFAIVLLCATVVLLGQGGAGLTTAVLIKALLVAGLTTAVAMMAEAWK